MSKDDLTEALKPMGAAVSKLAGPGVGFVLMVYQGDHGCGLTTRDEAVVRKALRGWLVETETPATIDDPVVGRAGRSIQRPSTRPPAPQWLVDRAVSIVALGERTAPHLEFLVFLFSKGSLAFYTNLPTDQARRNVRDWVTREPV